ncbi:ATP-binding cassette domain-containing protein [Acidianus brierleyi]|uniref:Molybdate/tungstate import ATP-binding protein WtpC n=1 Tax=Acidianus brierleyi TaxID=41673 RepID=A0A2U9IFU6_9CREN|nr:ATP-binding cassette domain-containing protein [Acidianus brierleyi]AWR94889.1 ATP-binding cassette domain-containing protein [Acidianus brierleyi]
MIETKLEKHFKNFILNSELNDAGIICITGNNGSGKTTFLNLLLGIYKPDKGYVKINNKDITKLPVEKRRIAFVNQDSYIPELTVDSHILWGAKLRKIKIDDNEIKDLKEALGIKFSGKVKNLSLGQKERVAILTAILSKPYFLLVDEAFSNISDKKDFLSKLIEILKKYDIEMIFTTQDLEDVKFSEKHYIMNRGILRKSF